MSHTFQTVAGMACLKSLLMVFNFIFWLSGITILAIGIWMEADLYKYMKLSTGFSNTVSYVLIGTGICIFLIGTFACCCTLKGQPTMLYIYGSLLAAIFVLEIGCAVSIYAYRAKLSEGFNNGLTDAIRNYHNSSTHIAEDFDYMQKTLHCCGNHGPADWLKAVTDEIPSSCCIEDGCDTENDSEIYKEGCYNKVLSFLNSNITIIAVAAMCVALFPLVGLILSCCLASLINKHKYEQMA